MVRNGGGCLDNLTFVEIIRRHYFSPYTVNIFHLYTYLVCKCSFKSILFLLFSLLDIYLHLFKTSCLAFFKTSMRTGAFVSQMHTY